MKFLKCLFISLLSIGIVSPAFSQGVRDLNRNIITCMPGVYTGRIEFDSFLLVASYPFKMEVVYKPAGVTPAELIFFLQSEGEQLCVPYINPDIEIRANENGYVVKSRLKGLLGIILKSRDDFFFSETCDEVGFDVFGDISSGYKTSKIPRGFIELKRICDSLPKQ